MNINWQARELNLKVVYYGPSLSGKTTNLEQIHARINPQRRSDLVSLKTRGDRTLFFDFMQIELGKVSGLTPKMHLYTVPGQTYYEASRRTVLRGVDGLVFVADSNPTSHPANLIAWADMESGLQEYGLKLENLPVVLQCNKQDLPNAISPQRIAADISARSPSVHFTTLPAAASRGIGVLETMKVITRDVMAHIQKLTA